MNRDPVPTLLLDANGHDRRAVLYDTLFRGLAGVETAADLPRLLQRPWWQRKVGVRYESLSYVLDWRDALVREPSLDVERCELTNLVAVARCRRAFLERPLIIVLHAAFGDSVAPLRRVVRWLRRRSGRLVVFVGNEYDQMAEKIALLQDLRADVICTQLPLAVGRWLYAECEDAQVVEMAHALNPELYSAPPAESPRGYDLGFAGNLYDRIIGDRERTRLIEAAGARAKSWGLELRLLLERVDRGQWADFLRSCHGILGAESGTYYLDRRGMGVARAKEYIKKRPEASFEEVFEHAFRDLPEARSGKCVSSRHFEACGTGTCQVLVEGHYNGLLRADEHYIAVKPDLSNLDAAMERFRDPDARRAIAERAYQHALERHTYAHRVRALLEAIGPR